jgi:hypothetical protein
MVIARVRFLGPEQGGRQHPPLPGYHPEVAVRDEFTSCAIESLEDEATFAFDRDHLVSLHLLFPKHYPDAFAVGGQVRFYEGSHLVGSGTILDIC